MIILVSLAPIGLGAAEHSSDPFDYQEVINLIKSQLPDLKDEDIQSAAARGLIRELEPRVRLVMESDAEAVVTNAFQPTLFTVYDDHYGYVRLTDFQPGMAEPAARRLNELVSTNRLKGLVMDLRFARGESYADAAQLADLFFESEHDLIDWGKGLRKSTAKTSALELPVAVLINAETAAAAEALAAMLRHGNVGLLIGSKTAGQASMYRDFELTTGQRLRIATDPVKVGAEVALSVSGVKPDILVAAPSGQEKLWLNDPYKLLAVSAGKEIAPGEVAKQNATARRHLNEADLVRMLREGEIPDLTQNPSSAPTVAAKPVIQDPVLARALDFLKGLALVRQFRPN